MASYKDDFPAGLLEGAKGTYPGPTPDAGAGVHRWPRRLRGGVGRRAAEGLHLRARVVRRAHPARDSRRSPRSRPTRPTIAEKLIEVSGGSGDGEKCESFEACADIILAGDVADYDGVSSPVTFDEVGDPTEGFINIYQYGADNTYTPFEG